ncbi:MAG TPA: acyltransferase family protein, partial [Herpetosiphonaceae bacterium]|nr:acyltransferase family protein [Herpetosiphonaceae bacterium]
MSEAQPESTSAAMDERGAALPYCAGIDGLRALAVTAVLLYHAGLPLPGGFLGVEVFFVLSGYLITALLRAEWERAGSIRLGRFWARRARRLLPALALALGGTALLAGRLAPRESADLPGDMLAALGYVMNWRLVASAQSYFAPLARPPLLQHLWSLAVEEQFYLLWPLIFIGGMRLLRRRGLLGATLLAAAGSALLMAVLRRPGLDPARVYYGTDTRAAGLLLGAALALAWPPGRQPAAELRLAGWLADGLGLAGLLALATCARLLYAGHPRLYPGGFATAAIGTAAIIAAVTHPRARVLPALLGGGIPRWIGMRSYGIYLWHWPIFMLTRPRLDVALDGWPLLALRLGAVVGLAAFSFRVVEQPLRRAASPPPRRDPARSLAWGVTLAGIAAIAAGPLMLAAPRAIRAGGSPVGPPPAACPPGTGAAGCAAARPAAASGGPTPSPRPAPLSAGIAAQPPMDLPAELQAILDATVADTYVPGAVMAVSIPGQAPWVGAAGVYDWETKTPMRPDTPVFIGSVSKMFTAVISL